MTKIFTVLYESDDEDNFVGSTYLYVKSANHLEENQGISLYKNSPKGLDIENPPNHLFKEMHSKLENNEVLHSATESKHCILYLVSRPT